MAFVNEYVSEEDDKKYGLEAIDKRYFIGHALGYTEWTRDRERDIYLRFMRHQGEDGMYKQTFTFYWRETLLEVRLDLIDGGGEPGGKGWIKWSLRHLSLPESLAIYREQILADLKDALRTYGGGGTSSAYTECDITLEL